MIIENAEFKIIESPDFNLVFRKADGYTETWGRTKDENPDFSPEGPIICDMEISEVCHEGCKFCYKANVAKGANMTFETFKTIFHKLPRTLNQIAFGWGSVPITRYYKKDGENDMIIDEQEYIEITKEEYIKNKGNSDYLERDEEANPDLKKIITYCKNNDYQYIVPNATINGSRMTPEWYDFFAANLGAIAISHYNDDRCFNAVHELTNRGMQQVNIHKLVSEETYEECMNLIDIVQKDPRLIKLNAVVFLMLKKRGRGEGFNVLSDDKYRLFINKLFDSGINFGFDSCGAGRLLKYGVSKEIENFITPCESTRESCYINTHGKFYPCSFNEEGEGIDVASAEDFIRDVWMQKDTHNWRNKLLENNCSCPTYEV